MSKPCATCAGSGIDYIFDVEGTCDACHGTGDQDAVILGIQTDSGPINQRLWRYGDTTELGELAPEARRQAVRTRYRFSTRRFALGMAREVARLNALFFWAAGMVLLCQGAYLPSIAASCIACPAVLFLMATSDE